jgi:hypothetical protein
MALVVTGYAALTLLFQEGEKTTYGSYQNFKNIVVDFS